MVKRLKCDYPPCERDVCIYEVTNTTERMKNSNYRMARYCSVGHIVLGMMEKCVDMANVQMSALMRSLFNRSFALMKRFWREQEINWIGKQVTSLKFGTEHREYRRRRRILKSDKRKAVRAVLRKG